MKLPIIIALLALTSCSGQSHNTAAAFNSMAQNQQFKNNLNAAFGQPSLADQLAVMNGGYSVAPPSYGEMSQQREMRKIQNQLKDIQWQQHLQTWCAGRPTDGGVDAPTDKPQ